MKNIIFDFGNVLIDLDFSKTLTKFTEWFEFNNTDYFVFFEQHPSFKAYELGRIDERTFLDALRKASSKTVSYKELIDAWNLLLLEIKPERFDMLNRLRQKYNVYLLSNTNDTHIRYARQYVKKVHGIEDFDALFTKAYYSHIIHLRKPNRSIYEYALQDANIKPEETLFIDDHLPNIIAAQKLGIHTIHHKVGDEIVDVMKNY